MELQPLVKHGGIEIQPDKEIYNELILSILSNDEETVLRLLREGKYF